MVAMSWVPHSRHALTGLCLCAWEATGRKWTISPSVPGDSGWQERGTEVSESTACFWKDERAGSPGRKDGGLRAAR